MGVNGSEAPAEVPEIAPPRSTNRDRWILWILWILNAAVLCTALGSCELSRDVQRLQDRIDQMPRFVFQVDPLSGPPAEVPVAPVENET